MWSVLVNVHVSFKKMCILLSLKLSIYGNYIQLIDGVVVFSYVLTDFLSVHF